MALFISEGDDRISIAWHFKTDLFDTSTIARLASHFERVLEGVVADPDQPITKLRLIDKKKPERIRRPRAEMEAVTQGSADEDSRRSPAE
jgi:hypothetical protein